MQVDYGYFEALSVNLFLNFSCSPSVFQLNKKIHINNILRFLGKICKKDKHGEVLMVFKGSYMFLLGLN